MAGLEDATLRPMGSSISPAQRRSGRDHGCERPPCGRRALTVSAVSLRVRLVLLAAVAGVGLGAAGPSLARRSTPPASPPGKPTTTPVTLSQGSGNPSGQTNSNGKPGGQPTPAHKVSASGSAQGIVQSVGAGSVVLTQLDGSSISISVTAGTRVFVNGSHAGVVDVKPGFVASAAWVGGKTRVLQAFDLSSAAIEVGVVKSISGRLIVVTTSEGRVVRVRVGPKTRVLLDGDPTALSGVKAGDTVVFAVKDAQPGRAAGQLRFLQPI